MPQGSQTKESLTSELLTAEEAVAFLGLDRLPIKDPKRSLSRYRAKGEIRGLRLGPVVLYSKPSLEAFVERRMAVAQK